MRNTMRVLGAVVILSAVFAIGCAAEPATVEISPPDVTVNAITDSPKLTAKVMDEAGKVIPDAKVAWSTVDEGVLAIDPESGVITVKASGRAEINADSGIAKGISMVTVALYKTLKTDTTSVDLNVGKVQEVSAMILNEKGEEIQGEIVWRSADEKIAKLVGSRGQIQAVGAGATAVIATAKMLKAEVMVVVAVPGPAELGVSKSLVELKVGKTAKIEGKPLDENGEDAKGYNVRYDSYDSAIASVADDGTITGVAPGETRVEVAAGDKTVSVKVKVK
jgi:uncharacterized protein YjdB